MKLKKFRIFWERIDRGISEVYSVDEAEARKMANNDHDSDFEDLSEKSGKWPDWDVVAVAEIGESEDA